MTVFDFNLPMARLYGLDPVALPLRAENLGDWDSASLAVEVASLGYPGFRQLAQEATQNPATVLLAAIAGSDVEVRVVEALPWLATQYYQLDWEWLIREATLRELQNRLGFLVTLARQVAEQKCDSFAVKRLQEVEQVLDRSRLVREDTLCQASLSKAERQWLRWSRPREAVHWSLLTDLEARLLPYAA